MPGSRATGGASRTLPGDRSSRLHVDGPDPGRVDTAAEPICLAGRLFTIGQGVQARDRELFDGLYSRLLVWVTAATGDRELAQDIAAESFARLLARAGRVREPGPYPYATATHLIRDDWRNAAGDVGCARR